MHKNASFLGCFVFFFVPKRRKLEGGALKAEAAKYSTEVQQKEHKRKVPKATLRNKGQGVATTEEKQKAQKAAQTNVHLLKSFLDSSSSVGWLSLGTLAALVLQSANAQQTKSTHPSKMDLRAQASRQLTSGVCFDLILVSV